MNKFLFIKIFSIITSTILLLSLFIRLEASQNVKISRYTVDQGLSHNVVQSIAQDKQGFIWIGTKNGLNRFDGHEIVQFQIPTHDSTQLLSNFIRQVVPYDEQYLFIGTDNGLYRFHLDDYIFEKIEFNKEKNQSSSQSVYNIQEIKDGKLLVSFLNNLYKYDPVTGFRTNLLSSNKYSELVGVKIKSIIQIDSFFYYLTVGRKLYCDNGTTLTNVKLPGKNNLTCLAEYNGYLLVGTSSGEILRIENETKDIYNLSKILPGLTNKINFVNQIVKNSKESFYLFSKKNMFLCDIDQRKLIKIQTPKLSKVKRCLIDKSGILWAGTNGAGLIKIVPKQDPFISLSHKNHDLSFSSIRAIYVDEKNNLWVGGLRGLNLFKDYQHKSTPIIIPEFNNSVVYSIIQDDNNNEIFWIARGRAGLAKYNRETRSVKKIELNIFSNTAMSLVLLKGIKSENGDLFFGTNYGLLISIKGEEKFKLLSLDKIDGHKFIKNRIETLVEDSHHNIWIGTENSGIYIYSPNGEISKFKDTKLNLPIGFTVNHFYEDKNKNLWIATSVGLIKYNEGKHFSKLYNKNNGFPNNHIYSILADTDSILWLGSGKGIIRFNTLNEKIRLFYSLIDLPIKEFNTCAYFKDKFNTFFFGGIAGLVYFNPNQIKPETFEPRPIFSRFTKLISTRNIKTYYAVPQKLNLDYTNKYFSFDLTTNDYKEPATVKYRYKLNSNDDDWIYLNKNNRTISFYKLKPDNYFLTISATDRNGDWSPIETNLFLEIKPPIWETFWFRISLLILMLFVVFVLYRKRIEYFKREKLIREEFSKKLILNQEKERENIAGNLHDSLGQDIIVVKNKLLLATSGKNSNVHLKESIEILSKASSEISNLSHLLRPVELDDLGLTLAIESMVERLEEISEISFKINLPIIDNYFDGDAAINLFRIIQEALNNIMKHSLANSVNINAEISNNFLQIDISDNGIGFSTEDLSKKTISKPAHFGIASMKERIRILNGVINIIPSKAGTTIELKIPIFSREGENV